MPTEPTEQQWIDIQQELFAGRKIQAIKLYRQFSEADLKTAKDAMDAYEEKLRAQAPERFSAPAKSGCFSVILLVIGLLGAGWIASRVIG